MAGAASLEVMLPRGIPLGGYGGFPRRAWLPDVLGRSPYTFWFSPSTGVHDPFRVRSLILQWQDLRVLWLAVDLVGIDPTLVSALKERLGSHGLSYSALIISASHTHSGPGAYVESALFGFVAIDRVSSTVRDRILDGLERAAREAESRKVPAIVALGRTEVTGLAESRVHEALDPELGLVKVMEVNRRRPVALVWNYAIHGTALGQDNFLLSGDLMSEASARLERAVGVPALFVNGAVGDVSPRRRGWAGVKAAGEALATGALRAWTEARGEPGRLEVARERVALPRATVALKNCVGGWAPAWMTLGVSEAFPASAELIALAIGRTAWVVVPGELETRLGLDIKQAGRERFSHVFIAGVSNDYLGYFLAPDHYRQPSYIACASLYGERGGDIIRDAAIAAIRRLGVAESAGETRAVSEGASTAPPKPPPTKRVAPAKPALERGPVTRAVLG